MMSVWTSAVLPLVKIKPLKPHSDVLLSLWGLFFFHIRCKLIFVPRGWTLFVHSHNFLEMCHAATHVFPEATGRSLWPTWVDSQEVLPHEKPGSLAASANHPATTSCLSFRTGATTTSGEAEFTQAQRELLTRHGVAKPPLCRGSKQKITAFPVKCPEACRQLIPGLCLSHWSAGFTKWLYKFFFQSHTEAEQKRVQLTISLLLEVVTTKRCHSHVQGSFQRQQ